MCPRSLRPRRIGLFHLRTPGAEELEPHHKGDLDAYGRRRFFHAYLS